MPSIAYPNLEDTFRAVFLDHVKSLFDGAEHELRTLTKTLPECDWFFDVHHLRQEPKKPTFVLPYLSGRRASCRKCWRENQFFFHHSWRCLRSLWLKMPLGDNPGLAKKNIVEYWACLGEAIAKKKTQLEDSGIYHLAVTPVPVIEQDRSQITLAGQMTMQLWFFYPSEVY